MKSLSHARAALAVVPAIGATGTAQSAENDVLIVRKLEEDAHVFGMGWQKPNLFPKSVYEKAVYGPRNHGLAAPALTWTGW